MAKLTPERQEKLRELEKKIESRKGQTLSFGKIQEIFGVQASDHCYNRTHYVNTKKMIMRDWEVYPPYFKHTDDGYIVLGPNYPYSGDIIHKPDGCDEYVAGNWENGQRYMNKPPAHPNELPNNSPKYREGKKRAVNVTTYVRNEAAKEECISHYGATCVICKFDFGKTYGADFEGMIHVHHLNMISEYGDERSIDPIKDLRPVCPNCHMVIHSKKEGCYTMMRLWQC